MASAYDTTPKPAVLRALRNKSWCVHGALAELVDNSFGAGRGNAGRVFITYDKRSHVLTVLDDGQGMQAIGQLFRLGDTIGRTTNDIGEYGSGGTLALLWLAKAVEIWSLKGGLVSHDRVNWLKEMAADRFVEVSNDWLPADLSNTPLELFELGHGTLIQLHVDVPKRRIKPELITAELARTYSPGIRKGKVIKWCSIDKKGQRAERELSDPFLNLFDGQDVEHFHLGVKVGEVMLTVEGSIGLFENIGYDQSQVTIGFGHRVLKRTRECYSSKDTGETFTGEGVAGWLQLGDGWQPYLSTTKDDVDDASAWDALMQHIFLTIKPLLEKTQQAKLTVFFEGIALSLKSGFQRKKAKPELFVIEGGEASTGHERVGDGEHGRTPTPTPGSVRGQARSVTEEGDAAVNKNFPDCEIAVLPQSNEQMKGMLCKADIEPGLVAVSINTDHLIVQECMKQRPINKMALLLLVTREIATALTKKMEITKSALPKKFYQDLIDKDPDDQQRYIMRYLMDHVKGGAVTEEAEIKHEGGSL
jgi:hypothetical protein